MPQTDPIKRKRDTAKYRESHREYLRQKGKEYSHRPEIRKRDSEARKKLYYECKNEIFDFYGRICECCGETIPKFLTIDHVYNDGKRHRNGINRFGQMLKEIESGFSDRFRVLCMNCNWGKKMNGGIFCPHKDIN